MNIFLGLVQVKYLVLFLQPVFDQSPSLNKLCNFISQVACKEKPVSWLHFVGKSHESQGVTTQCKCHSATNDFWRFLHVINSSNRKSPVGYWPPKVRAHQVVPELLAAHIVRGLTGQRPRHGGPATDGQRPPRVQPTPQTSPSL